MKRASLTLSMLVLAAATALAGVSKEDLKKLIGAGVSDDVILAYVRANGPVAALSADDVVDLKKAGASDKLLEGLMGGKAEPSKSVTPPPPQPQPTPPPVVEKPVYIEKPVVVEKPVYVYPSNPATAVAYCTTHDIYDYCYTTYNYYPSYSCTPSTRYYWYRSCPSYSYYYNRGHCGRGWSFGIGW